MQAWLALSTARQFLDASHLCAQALPERDGLTGPVMIPRIVCTAFAAEVALKSILLSENKSAHGHKMYDLYTQIDESMKTEIVARTSFTREQLEEELRRASTAFVEWRYVYEATEPKAIYERFLMQFAEATIGTAQRRIGAA
jgi:hypothetical protein